MAWTAFARAAVADFALTMTATPGLRYFGRPAPWTLVGPSPPFGTIVPYGPSPSGTLATFEMNRSVPMAANAPLAIISAAESSESPKVNHLVPPEAAGRVDRQ